MVMMMGSHGPELAHTLLAYDSVPDLANIGLSVKLIVWAPAYRYVVAMAGGPLTTLVDFVLSLYC